MRGQDSFQLKGEGLRIVLKAFILLFYFILKPFCHYEESAGQSLPKPFGKFILSSSMGSQ
jgi:hypothetical protein